MCGATGCDLVKQTGACGSCEPAGFKSAEGSGQDSKRPAPRFRTPAMPHIHLHASMHALCIPHLPPCRHHRAPPLELVAAAVTARSALDCADLERLETLGDAYLKFAVSWGCGRDAPGTYLWRTLLVLVCTARGVARQEWLCWTPACRPIPAARPQAAATQCSPHMACSNAGVCPALLCAPPVPRGPADQAQGDHSRHSMPACACCACWPVALHNRHLPPGHNLALHRLPQFNSSSTLLSPPLRSWWWQTSIWQRRR